jgi:hypothetical protein
MEVPLETIILLAGAAGVGLGIIICKFGEWAAKNM